MNRLVSALLGGAILAAAPAAFAEFDKVRWKMPIAFASTLPGLGSPSQYVAGQLKAVSAGTVQVKIFEPGKLVPPFDILSAVSSLGETVRARVLENSGIRLEWEIKRIGVFREGYIVQPFLGLML